MEYLLMIKASVVDNWMGIVAAILPFFLPNKVVYSVGKAIGTICTKFLRQKTGKTGEAVEKYFQGTLIAFTSGINDGLDSDDEV